MRFRRSGCIAMVLHEKSSNIAWRARGGMHVYLEYGTDEVMKLNKKTLEPSIVGSIVSEIPNPKDASKLPSQRFEQIVDQL